MRCAGDGRMVGGKSSGGKENVTFVVTSALALFCIYIFWQGIDRLYPLRIVLFDFKRLESSDIFVIVVCNWVLLT